MIRLRLNTKKPNNYAFFCPVSKLHLTLGSPLGSTGGLTPAILRGLRSGVLVDVDNVVNLNTGTVLTPENQAGAEEPKQAGNGGTGIPPEEVPLENDSPSEEASPEDIQPKQQATPKKNTSRKKQNKETE